MNHHDCVFLKPPPPRPPAIAERPIPMAELVQIWRRSGVITHYPHPIRRLTWGDVAGVASIVGALAFSLGYFLGG